jgi:anti-sigma28 factor (negative regulator of flagellin synthesis)
MGCVERGDSKITPPARSTELKLIEKLASECPDVRENMVSQLRSQILGGVYEIDPENVAEKIIQHSIITLVHFSSL